MPVASLYWSELPGRPAIWARWCSRHASLAESTTFFFKPEFIRKYYRLYWSELLGRPAIWARWCSRHASLAESTTFFFKPEFFRKYLQPVL